LKTFASERNFLSERKTKIRKERRKLLSETKETIFLKCPFLTPNRWFGGEEAFEEKLLSPRMKVGDRSFFLTFLKVLFWKGNKKRSFGSRTYQRVRWKEKK